jgi:hypothetical protein
MMKRRRRKTKRRKEREKRGIEAMSCHSLDRATRTCLTVDALGVEEVTLVLLQSKIIIYTSECQRVDVPSLLFLVHSSHCKAQEPILTLLETTMACIKSPFRLLVVQGQRLRRQRLD